MRLLLFSIITTCFFSFSILKSSAFAQESDLPATAAGVPVFDLKPKVSGPQKVLKSNVACVKVGDAREEDKSASCNQPTPGSGSHPQAPAPQGDLQIEVQRQFGISMIGFDQQHLQWAWEKFWEVSGTNFNSLVRGAVIEVTDISSTSQIGCPPSRSVLVGQFPEETAFKHILTHELGHVIRNCAGRQVAQETAFLNAYSKEGGVSYYANNAFTCTKSDNPSEDYAEMIAFYLNPGTPVASYLKCYPAVQSRYTEQGFPLHHQVAQNVLGDF